MANPDKQQNAEFLAAQHQYTREKEKADKVLARYDSIMKFVLSVVGGIFGIIALMTFMFKAYIPCLIILLIGGIITFVVYRVIKKLRDGHQAKLDSKLIDNLKG